MNKRALTIMEIMVVVVIVGVMAAFAVPNFVKANTKNEEKQLIVNLRSIVAAQEIYKAKNGNYWPANIAAPIGNQGIGAINTALRLNILVSGTRYVYACESPATQTYRCYATFAPSAFAWQLYTDQTVGQGTTYANQVCCDKAFSPSNPCPTVPWCP